MADPFLMTSSTRSACRCFRYIRVLFLHAFLRYPLKKWWKVRVERGYPMLTAIPLLTLPQFIMLQYVKGKAESWLGCHCMTNIIRWPGINITPVVLLVLVVMTTLCVWIFKRIRNNLENSDKTNKKFSMVKLSVIFCASASVMR